MTVIPATFMFLFGAANVLYATDKYWAIRDATLIVVGTLHTNPIYPWFDGWRLTGTIDVDEVLLGTSPTKHIDYRFLCKYSQCNDLRPMIRLSLDRAKEMRLSPDRGKVMWFLKPVNGQVWQPTEGFGAVDLSQRSDFEDRIRRTKY